MSGESKRKQKGSDDRPQSGPTRAGRPGRRKTCTRAAAQAARFGRVRRDHSTEIAEDYVELIAQLITNHGEARAVDIAEHLGVSHVTVTKTVARLRRDGLVSTEPYRAIFLTDKGRQIAEESAARHEMVVRFLRKLGVEGDDAEVDAEGMEHHLSAATLAAIRRFVEEGD
ncbi:MAG: manganese-binding transcriptional regulator MntR [Phycisphaerae bacterium]